MLCDGCGRGKQPALDVDKALRSPRVQRWGQPQDESREEAGGGLVCEQGEGRHWLD